MRRALLPRAGAGADQMDSRALRYLVDNTPQVLHASEGVSVPGPIPPSGTGVAVTRFTDIWDKGKAAVIWSETTVKAPDGRLLWTQKRSIFARGEGGFGGEVSIPVLPQQTLLYRFCGDRNPLHSDPEFASAAGFPHPILHGLCTYGMGCKAIVDTFLDGDVSRVRFYGARFAGVVFAGETLNANIWKEKDRFVALLTAPARGDEVVLSGVELVPA